MKALDFFLSQMRRQQAVDQHPASARYIAHELRSVCPLRPDQPAPPGRAGFCQRRGQGIASVDLAGELGAQLGGYLILGGGIGAGDGGR